MGSNAVDNGLRGGCLHRLHPGVYTVGHRVVSGGGRWMAAVLAGGDGAVLSHRSAAALWGIVTYSGAIEITSPRDTRSRGAIRRHCTLLPPDEVTVLDDLPVTSVHRTLFDYAGDLARSIVSRPRSVRPSIAVSGTACLDLPCLLAIPALAAT